MSTRRRLFLSLLMAAILVLGLMLSAAHGHASPYEMTRHTLTGSRVALYNLVGSLEVVQGTGTSVVAEVTLKGKDAVRLDVQTGAIDGTQTLRVIYPSDRIVVPEFSDNTTSSMRVREDGTFGGKDHEHSGRKVILTGQGPGLEAGADIRLLVPAGKTVDVNWGHGKCNVTKVDADLSLDGASMPISVTGIKGSLHIDVGSGHVHVEDATADVWIDTGSGQVSLVRVKAQGIEVDTGSGEVTGSDLIAANVSIETGSGEIQVGKLTAQHVSLDTGSGEVTADLNEGIQSIEIDSGSGDVSVTIPKRFGAQLSVETGSGGIETNLTMETSVRKHDELVGRIGDGKGTLTIETGSGTVSIRQAGL